MLLIGSMTLSETTHTETTVSIHTFASISYMYKETTLGINSTSFLSISQLLGGVEKGFVKNTGQRTFRGK